MLSIQIMTSMLMKRLRLASMHSVYKDSLFHNQFPDASFCLDKNGFNATVVFGLACMVV